MARVSGWLTLLVAVALGGCDPAKELPTDLSKPDGPVAQPAVPMKSDPEAKVVIDKAVSALTGGKPELLGRAKSSTCSLKGHMFFPEQPNQSLEAARNMTAVWPDKFRFSNETYPGGTKLVVESWLRRPDLVVHRNGIPDPFGNSPGAEQNLANDAIGQHWMPLVLPASDPKAVVFDLQTITFEKRELNVLKLALGEFPVYALTFDGKAGHLLRVDRMGRVARFAIYALIPASLLVITSFVVVPAMRWPAGAARR